MSIHLDPANKGKLHRALHVPEGQKLTLKELMRAKHSEDPALRKRANFAMNARKWNHK